jgi:hypothetical protein
MYRSPCDIKFGNICKGNITVAGDAMHPMTPDLGQNECAALEDAVVLGQQIGELIASKASLGPTEVAQALAKKKVACRGLNCKLVCVRVGSIRWAWIVDEILK